MSTVVVLGRMLLALVVVLGIMWALARWARKPLGGKTDRVMSVLARQQLSRTSSVTVLQVMDRALVLGVTEQGIRLITETDLQELQAALDVPAPGKRRAGRVTAAEARAAEAVTDGADAPRAPAAGPLAGSVLSPATWRQLVDSARELTVRR